MRKLCWLAGLLCCLLVAGQASHGQTGTVLTQVVSAAPGGNWPGMAFVLACTLALAGVLAQAQDEPTYAEHLARIDHRFGNEGDFGRPERFSESFAIDPVQVE